MEHLGYYWNARFLTEDGHIPVRGQGRKKTQEDKDVLEDSEWWFKMVAKYGPLNLPLDMPGFFSHLKPKLFTELRKIT